MSHEHVEIEAVPGLPGELPPGERLLWQGRPSWRSLALRLFHLRGLTVYFALLVAARGVTTWSDAGAAAAVTAMLEVIPLALACLALLALLARVQARSTIYSITSRRVVLRVGYALPLTFNLPFRSIASADVRVRGDGEGDVVLRLAGHDRLAWLHLWPHVQPWHLGQARPMLRDLPGAAGVASVLGEAVRAWARENAAAVKVGEERSAPVHVQLVRPALQGSKA